METSIIYNTTAGLLADQYNNKLNQLKLTREEDATWNIQITPIMGNVYIEVNVKPEGFDASPAVISVSGYTNAEGKVTLKPQTNTDELNNLLGIGKGDFEEKAVIALAVQLMAVMPGGDSRQFSNRVPLSFFNDMAHPGVDPTTGTAYPTAEQVKYVVDNFPGPGPGPDPEEEDHIYQSPVSPGDAPMSEGQVFLSTTKLGYERIKLQSLVLGLNWQVTSTGYTEQLRLTWTDERGQTQTALSTGRTQLPDQDGVVAPQQYTFDSPEVYGNVHIEAYDDAPLDGGFYVGTTPEEAAIAPITVTESDGIYSIYCTIHYQTGPKQDKDYIFGADFIVLGNEVAVNWNNAPLSTSTTAGMVIAGAGLTVLNGVASVNWEQAPEATEDIRGMGYSATDATQTYPNGHWVTVGYFNKALDDLNLHFELKGTAVGDITVPYPYKLTARAITVQGQTTGSDQRMASLILNATVVTLGASENASFASSFRIGEFANIMYASDRPVTSLSDNELVNKGHVKTMIEASGGTSYVLPPLAIDSLGGAMVKANSSVSVTPEGYIDFKVGQGLTKTAEGDAIADFQNYPKAGLGQSGFVQATESSSIIFDVNGVPDVKIGDTLTKDERGVVDVQYQNAPKATSSTFGVTSFGAGILIDEEGRAYVDPSISYNEPSGVIKMFGGQVPPDGWLECDGSLVSRTTYGNLFAAIGTIYGSTTADNFKLPDFRGQFARGWDHGAGVDAGRALGTSQGDAIRNIVGEFAFGITGFGGFSDTDQSLAYNAYFKYHTAANAVMTTPRANSYTVGFDASRIVPTAAENRPKNIAVMYIIKI